MDHYDEDYFGGYNRFVRAFELIRGLSNAKYLSVINGSLAALERAGQLLPILHGVTYLRLDDLPFASLSLIPRFLKSAPNLKVVVKIQSQVNDIVGWTWFSPGTLRTCLSNLEEFEIQGAEIISHERSFCDMINYIIENAKSLKLTMQLMEMPMQLVEMPALHQHESSLKQHHESTCALLLCLASFYFTEIMASGSRFTYTDMQNPLFLHPSDGPNSVSVSKLEGAVDYRAWRRQFEIQLSAKRKLGFVDGSVTRSITDATEATQWDTYNNMVISWIHNNISNNIKSSVLFINTASEIWKQLETRFLLTNGSRKYKLSKDLFNLKQTGMKLCDYFTSLSSLWEELDSMNVLPAITTVTPEITKLMQAIETVKQEARLFQFLDGLDDIYSAQRSQLLMSCPLPSVEMACAVVQQEESQRDILNQSVGFDGDASAMYSKGTGDRSLTCAACGYRGHTQERCWSVTGYPKWHHKYRKPGQRSNSQQGKWSATHKSTSSKVANNVQGSVSGQSELKVTTQKIEQLLKLLPRCAVQKGSETDEELDFGFSGMVNVKKIKAPKSEWIMDSGTSDHMDSSLESMINVKTVPASFTINLPTGASAPITHIGDVIMPNGLKLLNVLHVPQFNHNLLSIHKLAKDAKCDVTFHLNGCAITDSVSKEVIAT